MTLEGTAEVMVHSDSSGCWDMSSQPSVLNPHRPGGQKSEKEGAGRAGPCLGLGGWVSVFLPLPVLRGTSIPWPWHPLPSSAAQHLLDSLTLIFLSLSLSLLLWHMEVPGWGSNLRHNSDRSCSNDNAGSLTPWATRAPPPSSLLFMRPGDDRGHTWTLQEYLLCHLQNEPLEVPGVRVRVWTSLRGHHSAGCTLKN